MKRIFLLFCFLSVVGLYGGCGGNQTEDSPQEISKPGNNSGQEKHAVLPGAGNITFSAWEAYWSNEAVLKEMGLLQEALQEVSHFAAYFNARNELLIPEETTQVFREVKAKKQGMVHYLSIVNDKINADGSSSLKDTEVLYDLFSQEEVMDRHIDSILKLAIQNGYDGIEIDYEAIRQDMDLWKLFLDFCEKLYARLTENQLAMRIVLEPSAPLDKLNLPQGPEYVMMCYNLHGSGSKPGPKADENFIKTLIENMEKVPGKKSFAFATGGFDWVKDGASESLTETQAVVLCEEYSVTPIRDQGSGALTFRYEDVKGKSHEVWYADGETLVTWMNLVKEAGDYGLSLWRLDGNREESLKRIKDWLNVSPSTEK